MRGIHDGLIGWAKLPRFTPAHAGNTSSATYIKRSGWVHPRSRGEYKSDAHNLSGLRGSPPLTRGILFQMEQMSMSMRFTPAHAVNTTRYDLHDLPGKVHPRSRGEYIFDAGFGTFDLGSSPLTRGIREKAERLCPISGFIPAHAGNTLRVFSGGAYSRVHPRSRGEYRPPGTSKRPITGSPPLTRGIPLVHVDTVRRHRFTPAHAGNTESLRSQWLLLQVHPRSRGEYSACLTSCHAFIGSPPLTRGIQTGENFEYTSSRFTPAHAGNTRLFFLKSCLPEVHPRSRGEYYLEEGKSNQGLGSPPLTRGIHGKSGDGTNPAWFTPAHAGNTCH